MRPGAKKLLRRAAIVLLAVVGLAVVAAGAGALWLRSRLHASLPRLEGEVALAGLGAAVSVERDDLGVPTIRGANRRDVARVTGFLHAQERFFQMDLLRRSAAGELSELIGPAVLEVDRNARVHRFRAVAERDLARTDAAQRALIEAYSEGVNAGLHALGAPPPEYLLLRTDPEPWRPEDVALVVFAMYADLQGDLAPLESDLGVLYEVLPPALADFLAPAGTEWDAPIEGEPFATPDIPGAEAFDLRRQPAAAASTEPAADIPGSNNWAVAGRLTADGGALLANDMHLPLRLPNIWYRASFVWNEHRATGVTLPGAPPLIAGSNGRVAWGYTNSQGDWSDLVVLEIDPAHPQIYSTPDGPRSMDVITERIAVKGAADDVLEVRSTIWGPIVDQDLRGRPRAQRWIAHDGGVLDLGLLRMELVRDLDEALDTAAATVVPTQNCVIADDTGRIGWTLMGPMPRRFGHDGRLPRSWAAGDSGWDGWLDAAEHPRVADPPGGRIWTANNRVVGGEMLRQIGDGGFAHGARARQIRDDLLAIERATARDMLAVQLDDRALLLESWRELLLDVLDSDAARGNRRREELRQLVAENWTGHASVDSAAFRMVRTFRLFLAEDVLGAITAPCAKADERFRLWSLMQWDGPLWRIVRERPVHLLDPAFASWDARLVATADRVIERFAADDAAKLADRTWGERNTVRIQHPISLAVPWLGRWLDLPPEPLPGDGGMPRVQDVGFGASERFVVSPGREDAGIFHMPGGQSGHFLSPYYRKGHEAWARGEPTPFLPGAVRHRLDFVPAGG